MGLVAAGRFEQDEDLTGGPNPNVRGLKYEEFNIVEKMFRVNTFSYIYLATMAMPKLIEGRKNGDFGSIIVVSSGAGTMGCQKCPLIRLQNTQFMDSLIRFVWR